MELYIIRHGETVWNAQSRLQGRTDIELNENGLAAAKKLSLELQNLDFDRIYSSPLKRAFGTAQILASVHGVEIIKDERLIEISFGIKDGAFYSEWLSEDSPYRFFFSNPGKYFPPEKGESIEALCERTRDFLVKEIEPLFDTCKRIMIVAHGALNAALICYLEGNDKEHFWGSGLKGNCEAAIYNYDGKRWEKSI